MDASKIEGLTKIGGVATGTVNIGKVTVNDTTGTLTYKLEKSTDQVTWTNIATVSNTSGTLSVTAPVDLAASTFYRVSVTTNSSLYNGATSNVVKSDAAVASLISTAEAAAGGTATAVGAAATGTVASLTAQTAGVITFGDAYLVLDQYGKKMTGTGSITDFTQGNASATATLGWNATGSLVGTYTNGGAAGTETLVFNGTTITISD